MTLNKTTKALFVAFIGALGLIIAALIGSYWHFTNQQSHISSSVTYGQHGDSTVPSSADERTQVRAETPPMPVASAMRFTGRVIDAFSDSPLRKVKITLLGQGIPPLAYTDSEGMFSFSLKDTSGDIRIIVNRKGYKPYDRLVSPSNSSQTEDIRLIPSPSSSNGNSQSHAIEVNKYTSTDILVTPGDYVQITAGGVINVGPVVGEVGPDGKASNFGVSLSGYSIVRSINHGSLLWRFKGEHAWQPCGSKHEFIARERGVLEFQVNDNDQSNNSPDDFFHVDVNITKPDDG